MRFVAQKVWQGCVQIPPWGAPLVLHAVIPPESATLDMVNWAFVYALAFAWVLLEQSGPLVTQLWCWV